MASKIKLFPQGQVTLTQVGADLVIDATYQGKQVGQNIANIGPALYAFDPTAGVIFQIPLPPELKEALIMDIWYDLQ